MIHLATQHNMMLIETPYSILGSPEFFTNMVLSQFIKKCILILK